MEWLAAVTAFFKAIGDFFGWSHDRDLKESGKKEQQLEDEKARQNLEAMRAQVPHPQGNPFDDGKF